MIFWNLLTTSATKCTFSIKEDQSKSNTDKKTWFYVNPDFLIHWLCFNTSIYSLLVLHLNKLE